MLDLVNLSVKRWQHRSLCTDSAANHRSLYVACRMESFKACTSLKIYFPSSRWSFYYS